jgi:uncharacterized protein YjiS (DUF1127 family)
MFLENTRGQLAQGIPGRLQFFLGQLRQYRALRRKYERTYSELARMSDRDLADIGISRLSIRDVAREAVYGR